MKTKNALFLLIPIVFLLLTSGCIHSRQAIVSEEITSPPLRVTEQPAFQREVLSNGMTVFLMEDKSVSLINFQALIHTGFIYEPIEKTGLAEIVFETMRSGGAGGMKGDDVDAALEHIGAMIGTGVDRDMAIVGGLCHKHNFASVFSLFHDILISPLFEEEKIALAVIGKQGEIARRDDNISATADREFKKILYGNQSPYARQAEYHTIDNISRKDIVEFHKQYLYPDNIILGVWGDFETADMLEILKRTFGSWQPASQSIPIKPDVDFSKDASVNLIEKKDATQSVIIMGHDGIQRDHPDYPAAVLLSRILGAGWYSRFSRVLRQEKGLAYEIWASFIAEFDYPGTFIAKAQTRNDRTCEVIELMKKEILSVNESITDEELSVAKEGLINSEVFWSDTKDKVIKRLIRYEFYGYPLDYPERLIEAIKKVTRTDIIRVSKELLFPDRLSVLVVGNPETFDRQMPPETKVIPLNP